MDKVKGKNCWMPYGKDETIAAAIYDIATGMTSMFQDPLDEVMKSPLRNHNDWLALHYDVARGAFACIGELAEVLLEYARTEVEE